MGARKCVTVGGRRRAQRVVQRLEGALPLVREGEQLGLLHERKGRAVLLRL